jgi:hypothetical protein
MLLFPWRIEQKSATGHYGPFDRDTIYSACNPPDDALYIKNISECRSREESRLFEEYEDAFNEDQTKERLGLSKPRMIDIGTIIKAADERANKEFDGAADCAADANSQQTTDADERKLEEKP